MSTWVIVGANRGIGLELTRQISERGDDVVAVCRSSSPELDALDVRRVTDVDITNDGDVDRLHDELSDGSIDVLVVVAGVLKNVSLSHLDIDTIRGLFEVNSIGPLRVVAGLRDLLANPSTVGLLTSRMGSIEDNTSGGSYAYRMSKAALNMAGKSLAVDLEPDGIAVTLLHPGFVRTEMTGGNGFIDPDEAARGLINRLDELDISQTGTFWHAKGEQLPW